MFTPQLVALLLMSIGLSMIAMASLALLRLSYGRVALESELLVQAALDVNYGLWPAGAGMFAQVYSLTHSTAISSPAFFLVLFLGLGFVGGYYGFARKRLVAARVAVRTKRLKHGA